MRSIIASACLAAGSLAAVATTARADYPDCMTGTPTPAALTTWRTGAVAALALNRDAEVAKSVAQCFPTQVPACLRRTQTYSTRNDNAGADKDAKLEDTPQRQPPKELLAPNAQGLQYFVAPNIEQIAKDKGWPVVRYKSRHSGGFDGQTPSLLMVYVPGDKVTPPVGYDRWLNFALPADDEAHALTPLPQVPVPGVQDFSTETAHNQDYPRTFTMVSMDRATDTAPAQVYFQMFSRNGTDSGIYTPEANSSVLGCVNCHPNGMRAISPLGYQVRAGEAALPDEAWNAVLTINTAMDDASGGKLVSWRSAVVDAAGTTKAFLHPDAFWPTMGAIRPMNTVSRTQAFIMGGTMSDGTPAPGCYNSRPTVGVTDIFGRPPGRNNTYTLTATPQINWENVRNAMLCETCHNNRNRYAINARTDPSTIDYKILVDQTMPLGAHQNPLDQGSSTMPVVDSLTPDERIALANCLQEEMRLEAGLLGKWLTQEACH